MPATSVSNARPWDSPALVRRSTRTGSCCTTPHVCPPFSPGYATALQPSISVDLNLAIDFRRNDECYRFIKWAQSTLDHFGVIPPGTGKHPPDQHGVPAAWIDHGTEPTTLHPDTLVAND